MPVFNSGRARIPPKSMRSSWQLPWQIGADFFLRHLHDGDAASNTLSWRWVAGLHTRGKSYYFPDYDVNDPADPGNSPGNRTFAPWNRTETLEYTDRTTSTLIFNGDHVLPFLALALRVVVAWWVAHLLRSVFRRPKPVTESL